MILYRFKIDDVLVHPFFGDEQARKWDMEPGEYFFRPNFTEPFIITYDEYDLIDTEDIEHEFTFLCEKNTGSGWVTYFTGYFTKFDVKPDDDNKIMELTPIPDDRYRKFLQGWDKEFNIIDLGIEKTTIQYKKYPILQVYLKTLRKGRLIQYSGGQVWEDKYDSIFDDATLLDEQFQRPFDDGVNVVGFIGHVSGSGLTDDVSGMYVFDPAVGYVSNDGLWKIVNGQTEIRRVSDNVLFYDSVSIDGDIQKFESSNNPGEFLQFTGGFLWARILCNTESGGGITTVDVGDDWLIDTYGFSKVRTDGDIPDLIFELTDSNQIPSTIYGKVGGTAINNVGNYYLPISASTRFPVLKSYWSDCSMWLRISGTIEVLLDDVTENITMRDAYRLDRVIKAILNEIDSNILHDDATTVYSQFLYGATNPMTGESQGIPYITARSNISVAKYDQAATIVNVKLKDLLQGIKGMHFDRFGYSITDDDEFILEHGFYYANGGSYVAQLITANLETLLEPQTGLKWGYFSKKWNFEKINVPGRIHPLWSDECSSFFKGTEMEMVSAYAEKERTENPNIPLIYTDVNYLSSNSNDVSKDGLVLMEIIDDGGTLKIAEETATDPIMGATVTIQNGNYSMTKLMERYGPYESPVKTIVINGTQQTAISVLNTKVQETLIFRINQIIDPLKMVVTSLGLGKVFGLQENMMNEENRVISKHDTQL